MRGLMVRGLLVGGLLVRGQLVGDLLERLLDQAEEMAERARG